MFLFDSAIIQSPEPYQKPQNLDMHDCSSFMCQKLNSTRSSRISQNWKVAPLYNIGRSIKHAQNYLSEYAHSCLTCIRSFLNRESEQVTSKQNITSVKLFGSPNLNYLQEAVLYWKLPQGASSSSIPKNIVYLASRQQVLTLNVKVFKWDLVNATT